MAGFDEAWAAVDHPTYGEPVSPELQPLLRRVYSEVLAAPADLSALKESLASMIPLEGREDNIVLLQAGCAANAPARGDALGL